MKKLLTLAFGLSLVGMPALGMPMGSPVKSAHAMLQKKYVKKEPRVNHFPGSPFEEKKQIPFDEQVKIGARSIAVGAAVGIGVLRLAQVCQLDRINTLYPDSYLYYYVPGLCGFAATVLSVALGGEKLHPIQKGLGLTGATVTGILAVSGSAREFVNSLRYTPCLANLSHENAVMGGTLLVAAAIAYPCVKKIKAIVE